jgi:hypothetical protein
MLYFLTFLLSMEVIVAANCLASLEYVEAQRDLSPSQRDFREYRRYMTSAFGKQAFSFWKECF